METTVVCGICEKSFTYVRQRGAVRKYCSPGCRRAANAAQTRERHGYQERQPRGRCSVEGCDRRHFGLGYCNLHYHRWRTTGDTGAVGYVIGLQEFCSVPDCVRPHKARGYCASHWRRFMDTGVAPTTPITPKPRGQNAGPCLRPNCDRVSRGSGYCPRHYARMRKFLEYGLSGWDEWDEFWTRSGGLCEICRTVLDTETNHFDHDHKTMKPRGLLCRGCNHGLGHFQDDPARLRAAAEYLEIFSP